MMKRLILGFGYAALGIGCALGQVAPASADPDIPPVSEAARAAGLVDVRTVVPDAVIDLRYATTNNFTGVQLYPAGARCLVHESMAPRPQDRRRHAAYQWRAAGLLGLLPPA